MLHRLDDIGVQVHTLRLCQIHRPLEILKFLLPLKTHIKGHKGFLYPMTAAGGSYPFNVADAGVVALLGGI